MEIWNTTKNGILKAAEKVCGKTRKHQWRKESWWWTDHVSQAVEAKRRAYRAWKKGGSREEYNNAKRLAKLAVCQAKQEASLADFSDIDPKGDKVFRIAKQMMRENQDVMGEKCVKNDEGKLALTPEAKKAAWKQHYGGLLNVEFSWNPEELSDEPPTQGPVLLITPGMAQKAISKMKFGKAAGPSNIVAEHLKASGEIGIKLITDLANAMIRGEQAPQDWEHSFIVNCYKGKGDALLRGNYRGLKLLDQGMKVCERIINTIIREQVNIDSMQFGSLGQRMPSSFSGNCKRST